MAVQTISYTNKVDLNTTSVADINKVNASDLNEIKSVVNNNANEITSNTTEITNIKNGLQFIHGTITPTVSGDSVQLFTLAQLRTQFNASTASSANFFAIVNNGDGSANGKHFENCTWVNNALFVVMDGTVSGVATRINYLIFYIP